MQVDFQDLLPGMAQMLEARLGRPGYHLATATVVASALFIIALPLGVLGAFFLGLVQVGIWQPSFNGGVGVTVVFDMLIVAGGIAGGLIAYQFVMRSLDRRARALQRDFDVHWRVIAGHVERHNREGDTEGLLVDAWHTHRYETAADLAGEKQGSEGGGQK